MALALTERYRYTYRDYLHTPDDGTRWEIVDGVPYMMAAPNTRHQTISMKLSGRLFNFLDGKRCRVFHAPFDVRLSLYNEKDEDATNVVQPDIVVYCNDLGTDEKGGRTAPDIAIEILSPSSLEMDKIRKFKLYEQAGVKEYWIVDAQNEYVEIYIHDGERFSPMFHYDKDEPTITSTILEGFKITTDDIFEQ